MASIRKVADGKYQIRWREPTYDALGKPTGTTRETSETITADSDKQAQKTAQRRKIQIETDLERGITPNSAKDAGLDPV